MTQNDIVVLDTNVFSLLRTMEITQAVRRLPEVRDWLKTLIGRQFVISFQTRAEVLQGAYAAKWGKARLAALHRVLDATRTIPADEVVIDTAARLFAEAKAAGHPLHDKIHTADRWIAASAMAYDLPLFTTDHVFTDTPGLRLFSPVQ